jgi:hypothetical protein
VRWDRLGDGSDDLTLRRGSLNRNEESHTEEIGRRYSARRTDTGSTLAARHAGAIVAREAAASSEMAAAANALGSLGPMPTRSARADSLRYI